MTTTITINLPDELVEKTATAVAKICAVTVPAGIAALKEQRVADHELEQMLAEMSVEYGEPTAEHYAWADRVLGIAPRQDLDDERFSPAAPDGRIAGMTTKIAISLPDELVDKARRAVAEGRAASVSAYIASLLAQRSADEELAELIAEMKAEHGEPTAEDYAWARRAIGVE